MIPLKFTLTGALGIKAGLNRDTISMDLSTIPEDAVTVAIKGDNGNGKSTIMNLALTPFRNPPHIDDIYSHFEGKGLRELEFSHNGNLYISSIAINQTAKTKSMSATLHVYDGEGFQPVKTADGTTSDGKAGTYDACLEYVLGPQSIYYMSAFKAQNAKPLADHDDPKSLMRDLLSLDEPDQLSTQAREVAKYLKQKLDSKRDVIANIETLEGRLVEVTTLIDLTQERIPALQKSKQTCVDAVTDTRAQYEKARTANTENVEVAKKHEELAERKRQIEADKSGEITKLNGNIQTLESRIQVNNNLLRVKDDVTAAEKRIPELETELVAVDQALSGLREQVGKLQTLRSDLREARTQCGYIAQDGQRLKASCEALQTRSAFVEKVPCGGSSPYNTCPALQDAINAKTMIEPEQAKINDTRSKWSNENAKAERLEQQIQAMGDPEAEIKKHQATINKLNIELSQLRQTAAKRHAIDQAQTIITDSDKELKTCIHSKAETLEKFNIRLAAISAEIAALPPINPDDVLEHCRIQHQKAEEWLTEATGTLARCVADIANYESEKASIETQLNNADAIKAEVEFIGNELATWRLLAMALKGVIDLSIEDAGPAISSIANQLLLEAYGPRFTLKIITQKPQGNGLLKETFDISVIDAESGIESSIVKKSGGEMVWLDKALTDAVALYHKDAAGIDYECLFADEAEDGLTNDRKEQFYRMDRAALNMGGYRRKFFISHNPSAWQIADHVIDLSGYRL